MDCQKIRKIGSNSQILEKSTQLDRHGLFTCLLSLWICWVTFTGSPEIHAQNIDFFEISLGQTIDEDFPFIGSGRIEEAGGQDIYEFDGSPGQTIFLDMISHDVSFLKMTWTVVGPDGKVLSLECFRCQDPGFIQLTRTGKYQIIVGTPALDEIGAYSFSLLTVPEPDVFAIQFGDTISPDMPGPHAGRIESPGASDRYQFEVEAGQQIIFRLLRFDPSLATVNWSLQSPTLGTLYFGDLIRYQPRILTLEEAGIFELVIGDKNNSATGEYELVIEGIPSPDEFEISLEEPVEIFNDDSGAGFIESSAAQDIYHWSMDAPGWIFLDLKEADRALQFAQWELFGAANQKVYSKFFFSGDPGLIFLESAGDYRMVIGGNLNSGTGDYRIHIQPVPPRENFDILIGDEVRMDLPEEGAGSINVPGAQDVYHFTAEAGQEIFVEVLQAERSLGFLTWQLVDGFENVLFDECLRCIDPGKITLEKGGDYQLRVGGFQHAGTGAYSFRIWDVPSPQSFIIESDALSILPDQPTPGAGRLESPGSRDIYLIDGVKGQVWYLNPTHATGAQNLKWRLTSPGGFILFDLPFRATSSHSKFFSLFQSGVYSLEFYKSSSVPSDYGFDLSSVDGCNLGGDGNELPLPELIISSPASGSVINQSTISLQGSIGLTPGSVGMDLMLVLDSSESLRKNDPDDLRQRAVSDFVASLPRGVNIRLGLVDFDHTAKLLQPLTDDFDSILMQLETLDQSGGTDIQQALEISMAEIIGETQPGVAQNIILFSDGESSEGSPAEIAFQSRDLNVKIHTLYLGESLSEGSSLLQSISNASCANFRHAKTASQLAEIFRNIANPVPIDRMELISSVHPDEVQSVSFGGQFWRANDIPVSVLPGSRTTFTVRLYTDEETPRVVEEFIEIRYQDAANEPPVLSPIRNRSIFEDGETSYFLDVTDADHALDLLTWDFESDKPEILSRENGINLVRNGDQFTLHLQPAPDAFGVVEIGITVQDPEGAISEDTFLLSVRPKNDPPTLNHVSDIVLNPGEPLRKVPLSGISDGSIWEDQPLMFSINISDTSVISKAEVFYEAGDEVGELQLSTVPGAEGVTEISITLSDGQGADHSITQVFQVTLLPQVNEPPSITWLEPESDTTYFFGDEILLKVAANDPEGEIQNVTFFANGEAISPLASVAQEIRWKPDQTGAWELRAEVEDDKTSKATTTIITLQVVERPPEFSISILSPGDPFAACIGDTIEVEVGLEGGAPEGTVVHLFAGDRLQGVRDTSPYLFQWEIQEIGDFLVTAHAFLEDGSVIKSDPIRAGISNSCRQVALLIPESPVEDPNVIREILFEMGIGTTFLPLETTLLSSLQSYDLVFGIEDLEQGISSKLVHTLQTAYVDLRLPVFVLGHRLASRFDTLSEREQATWRELTHLQSFGDEWLGDVFELQETGFFKSLLNGGYGQVEPFVLPLPLDRAISDESAEVIAFTGEADAFIRYPAGTEPDFDQPRKIIQNFPLNIGGDAHSLLQRKRLFQNAMCWALRCSGCSTVSIQASNIEWQEEALAGELVRQSMRFTNSGVCESKASRVYIDIPSGVVLEDIEMSKGLGWKRESDGLRVYLNLGRLPANENEGVDVQLVLRSLVPGKSTFQICSDSIVTESVCFERPFSITGNQIVPPKISIVRGDSGDLLLVVQGQEGIRYMVETSFDFQNWETLGSAIGVETFIPIPTNQNGVPLTLFYRASLAP